MEKTIEKLYEKLPEEGIQRTSSQQTKRGYDTTGYGYQWVVDHFNKTLGLSWGYSYVVSNESTGAYGSGQPYHDVTVDVTIWVENKENSRTMPGGHRSGLYSDAKKGAITNGIKKCAAMFGVGADAYRGGIDDDHTPIDDGTGYSSPDTKTSKKRLDFDTVKKELETMNNRAEMEEYYKLLRKDYTITEKMKPHIDKMFQEAVAKISQDPDDYNFGNTEEELF